MTFSARDLLFDDYSIHATGHDNPKLTGQPDAGLFNRHERYEVLYLLNKFCETLPHATVHEFQKAEVLLRDLPGSIRSQVGVMRWLAANWT